MPKLVYEHEESTRRYSIRCIFDDGQSEIDKNKMKKSVTDKIKEIQQSYEKMNLNIFTYSEQVINKDYFFHCELKSLSADASKAKPEVAKLIDEKMKAGFAQNIQALVTGFNDKYNKEEKHPAPPLKR